MLRVPHPPIRGRESIKAAYVATFDGQGGGSLQLRALAFNTEERCRYITGAYGYDRAKDIGKFTQTLYRLPASLGRFILTWTAKAKIAGG